MVNMDFHDALADICGNPLSKIILQSILMLTDTIYPPENQDDIVVKRMYKRHTALIDALETKDMMACEMLISLDAEATRQMKPVKKSGKPRKA